MQIIILKKEKKKSNFELMLVQAPVHRLGSDDHSHAQFPNALFKRSFTFTQEKAVEAKFGPEHNSQFQFQPKRHRFIQFAIFIRSRYTHMYFSCINLILF